MKQIYPPRYLVLLFILFTVNSYAQTPQGCNTAAIRAAFAATGHYTELVVSGQPCSLYFVNTTSEDNATAEADAETLGAHTAVMNDATENANVSAAINAAGWLGGGAVMWIGYHRTGTGDSYPFTPLDGTPLGYTNWNPGEPNDEGWGGGINSPGCYSSLFGCTFCTGSSSYNCTNGEQCVQMYSSGTWNDLSCASSSISLVEVNLCPQISGSNDTLVCTAGSTVNLTTTTILGSVPYTYNWTPGGQTTSSITVTPATTTAYSVTATDRYSCYSAKNINVTVVGLTTPTVTASSSSVCVGQNTYINYTGTYSGSAAFTWGIDGGTNAGSGPPDSVSWATSGTKNVTLYVTDQGCTSNTATLPITVNAIPIADAGPDVQFCSGSTANLGSAAVNGVSYSWIPTVGLSSSTVSNPVIGGVNPTSSTIVQNYTVTASANGCSSSDYTVVTLYAPIVTTFSIAPTSACINQNVVITYTGTNSAGATYNWSFGGGNVVSGSGQGPYTVNWSAAGSPNVSLNVTENGCTGTATTQSIAIGSPPVANPGSNQTVCSGGTVQLGSAAVGSDTYTWAPASNLDNANIAQPSFSYSNTAASSQTFTYTLTANDNGCTATASVNVSVSPPAPVPVVASGPLEFCDGNSVTLSFSSTYASYLWTNTSTSPQINVTTGGSYAAALIDASGCEFIGTPVTVTVDPNPTVNQVQKTDEQCFGEADGSLTVAGATGQQPYSYNWSTTPAQTSAAITNLLPGPYTVTVTDQKSCTVTGQYTINPAAFFGVTIDSVQEVSCYGFSDGTIFTTTTGGATAYSYLWSNGTRSAKNQDLVAGSYAITVTDAHGCTVTDSTVVTQPADFTVTIAEPLTMNFGDNIVLPLTVAPSGNYTYNWTPANTLSCADCPNPTSMTSQTTVYNVKVTNAAGCSNAISFTLNVNGDKHLFVPNAFTPNGDGTNDVFSVHTVGESYFRLQIFNRLGEKVYESNGIDDGWDGQFKGKPAFAGIYTYELVVVYLDGQNLRRTGTLTLLR